MKYYKWIFQFICKEMNTSTNSSKVLCHYFRGRRQFRLTAPKKLRCSSTVKLSNRISCCGQNPRLARTAVKFFLTSIPLIMAVPLVGSRKPATDVRGHYQFQRIMVCYALNYMLYKVLHVRCKHGMRRAYIFLKRIND